MTSTTRKESVSTFYRPIQGVTVTHIKQMYDLYASFYENTSLDVFLHDLSKKSGVILLTRKSDDQVVGFSTLTTFDLTVDGRRIRGIFSGDTIICSIVPRSFSRTRAAAGSRMQATVTMVSSSDKVAYQASVRLGLKRVRDWMSICGSTTGRPCAAACPPTSSPLSVNRMRSV